MDDQSEENLRRGTYVVKNTKPQAGCKTKLNLSPQKSCKMRPNSSPQASYELTKPRASHQTSCQTKLKPSSPKLAKPTSKGNSVAVKIRKVVVSKKKYSPPSGM